MVYLESVSVPIIWFSFSIFLFSWKHIFEKYSRNNREKQRNGLEVLREKKNGLNDRLKKYDVQNALLRFHSRNEYKIHLKCDRAS